MSDHPPHDPATLLDHLASSIGDRVGAGAVFGPPVSGDGVTVIPVARARFGFGGGGGPSPDGHGEGAGGGGGGSSRPIGFIEMRGDRVRFRRFPNPLAFVAGVLVLLTVAALLGRAARRCGRCGGGGCAAGCGCDDDAADPPEESPTTS
jgi:uncharacterized spore protein YtfJ